MMPAAPATSLVPKELAMPIFNNLIAPIAALLDKLIPDPAARDAAKLELLKLESTRDLDQVRVQMAAIVAEAQSTDPWTSRARPGFLYVMYALLLWAIPMGLISAVQPTIADGIARGMTAYLHGIPEELYALFGTGYLGYTAARAWGKAKGVER